MALPGTLAPRLKRLLESDMPIAKLRVSHKLMLMTAVALTAATAACGATAPLVLTDAQDSAVQWVPGKPLENVYPKALQKKGIQGQVVCRVTIDAMGRVTRVVAVKGDPSHAELAPAAVNAVKTFHFNNTLARPVVKMMAVKFELR
jgi:TonB family protein